MPLVENNAVISNKKDVAEILSTSFINVVSKFDMTLNEKLLNKTEDTGDLKRILSNKWIIIKVLLHLVK